jgi:hypothetical protein
MEDYLNSFGAKNNNNKSLSEWDVIHRERPVDVAHYWPSPPNNTNASYVYDHKTSHQIDIEQGVARWWGPHHVSRIRDKVSTLLDEMKTRHDIETHTGMVGHERGNSFKLEYPKHLLSTKIIVNAQRDDWEGQHRLMEMLASGACIFTDTMLSIPPDYVDGESIVVYNSTQDLQNKIMHYLENDDERLQIAQRGFDISLRKHRSWHRVEEIIFGRHLSNTFAERTI